MTASLTSIIGVLEQYRGGGFLLVLYAAAFVYLFVKEKDATARALFVYMPLMIFILFLMPPVHFLYSKVEPDAYYRLLWMLPMAATVALAAARIARKTKLVGLAAVIALIILGGRFTYSNVNVLPAENRLHISQAAIDISDFILNDFDALQAENGISRSAIPDFPASILSGDEGFWDSRVKAAFPGELVQFTRQYTSRINMPFGREMMVPQWPYHNDVFSEMELAETVDAAALAEVLKEAGCGYLVLNAAKPVKGDLAEYGYEAVVLLDGYNIFRIVPESE